MLVVVGCLEARAVRHEELSEALQTHAKSCREEEAGR